MTRQEFVRKWRIQLAGLALYGIANEAKGGPLQRAAHALEVPGQVERLLNDLYDDLAPKEPAPPRPAANGVPKAPERRV